MTPADSFPLVMVIDDEMFMRKLVASQLRTLGCKSILCHESGKDALANLATQVDKVSLILCDLQMPDMDGIEVLRRLGEMGYRGALILISGEDSLTMTMAQRLAKAHGLNLLGALRKPVEPEQLGRLLATCATTTVSHKAAKPLPAVCVNELAEGMKAGQLVNHYQPKVSTRSGRVVGMEALVRWQHPELGLIYPDAFIPLAEEHGLIDQLTQCVIAGPGGALAHIKQWNELGLNLHVAVNVSMDSLHDLNFPNVIAQSAIDAGVSLDHLVLEVTESRLSSNLRAVIDVLTRLRLKRLRLSIDDFGTGYSSLAQLHELPFDELKIDRRFVHRAHEDHALNSILEASINIGLGLGMDTTGEGVETVEDWRHLQRKGCQVAQGYWISRPMEASKVPDWIAKWNGAIHELPGLTEPAVVCSA
jgi:EAL domain-containing protein (putative c-di-GMP-specific phosphodiesterase class I)/FixJ family two-component response regulator